MKIQVKVNEKWFTALECWRVVYGKPRTPIADREYTVFKLSHMSPVGTAFEICHFVKQMAAEHPGQYDDIDGLLLCDPISNSTHYVPIYPTEELHGIIDLKIRGKRPSELAVA